MRLSYSWLQDFVKLPKNLTAKEISEMLTTHTAEVEAVYGLDVHLDKVVAGKVVEFVKHPKNDALHVAKVLIGTGMVQIVFGSDHPVHEGAIVPIALPGAQLPDLKIEKRMVSGVESEGMIASDKELGITHDASGLTHFPADTALGTPVAALLQLKDTVIEIDNKALTHRPDLWGHYGIARELAAMYGTELVPYLKTTQYRYLGVVTGKLLEVAKHPNADRLKVTKVDIGTDTLTIVCGANNIKPGQIVPVATMGTRLPDGMEIKQATIRSVESFGMLCSAAELDLGTGASGIFILPKDTPVGIPLREALARKEKEVHRETIRINNEDPSGCPRFSAVMIDKVSIIDSPQWLKSRLMACGIRPINTIVDLTNYIMLEYGQPMHAYDVRSIGSELSIRPAKENQKFITLDGVERTLPATASVVYSGKHALGIGGIMGGEGSAINDATTTIVLEAANWDAIRIRKTMSMLGLRTEAGIRYEKDLAPEMTEHAIQKALQLIQDICPDAIQVSPISTVVGTARSSAVPIVVSPGAVERVMGIVCPPATIQDILSRLGFAVTEEHDTLHVTRPWWRSPKDISLTEDVIEEIARIYGYQHIAPALPQIQIQLPVGDQKLRRIVRMTRRVLSFGGGYQEVLNYSFTNESVLQKMHEPTDDLLRIKNPIADHHTVLRPGLIGGLLQSIAENIRRETEMRFFEIGRVFLDELGTYPVAPGSKETLPKQPLHVSGIVLGDDGFAWVKGTVEQLMERLQCPVPQFKKLEFAPGWIHPGKQAEVRVADHTIGGIGQIHPQVAKQFDITVPVYVFDICLDDLVPYASQTPVFQPVPRYPGITRDISLIAGERTTVAELESMMSTGNDLLTNIELVDIYRGPQVGEGKKSMTFRLHYSDPEKTLVDAAIQPVHEHVLAQLTEKGISIRT